MKVGEFSLELINTETKEPMKEFVAADNKVYVEAEPDLEYFIRCRRERGKGRTSVELEVDGTKLGYTNSFTSKTGNLGLWKRQDGVSTHQSLKFVLKRTRGAAGTSSSSNMMPIGNVRASFHEVKYLDEMVEKKDSDKSHCLQQSSSSSVPVAASGAKKSFASVSGCATDKREDTRRWKRKKQLGQSLGQITIYYTSALGLSKLGILAPIAPSPAADAAPDATNAAAAARNNQGDDPVITEPDRKRVKTERTQVKPEPSGGNATIDLTGTTSNIAAVAAAPSNDNAVIDLTGDD